MTFGNYKLVQGSSQQTNEIQNLVFNVLNEYGLKQGEIDFCLKDVDLHYFQKGGYFGVLLDQNDKIVATGGLYKLDDQSVELRKMYLSSEHRGKGLGKFLLKALIEKAKELGFKRIELETASVLKEAIGLYQKFGFQPFNSDHIAARCDQAYELILR